jgi:hypothetical protein
MNDDKWMERAVKKPGALDRMAKRHHEPIQKAIKEGLKSKNPTTEKRAILARTFAKYRKGA